MFFHILPFLSLQYNRFSLSLSAQISLSVTQTLAVPQDPTSRKDTSDQPINAQLGHRLEGRASQTGPIAAARIVLTSETASPPTSCPWRREAINRGDGVAGGGRSIDTPGEAGATLQACWKRGEENIQK